MSTTGSTQKLAQIQQLPVYSETEEVAKILKEMLDDLATRLSVIDEVDMQSKKLVDDTYQKMIEWEKKLVVLADGQKPSSTQTCCPSLVFVSTTLITSPLSARSAFSTHVKKKEWSSI